MEINRKYCVIENIQKKNKDKLPCVVIMGKVGKTEMFQEMIEAKTWNHFLESFSMRSGTDSFLIPLFSSDPYGCSLGMEKAYDNYQYIKKECNHIHYDDLNWCELWRKIIQEKIYPYCVSLEECNKYLEENEKKIIFLVDDLESLYEDQTPETERNVNRAIKTLCRDVLNEITGKRYNQNFGMIIFIRPETIDRAIPVNVAQFKNIYYDYALTEINIGYEKFK